MKKIISALMALTITLCGVNSYSVSATGTLNIPPDDDYVVGDYVGYYEYVTNCGYIVKIKTVNDAVLSDDDFENGEIYPVNLTEEGNINSTDEFLCKLYNDTTFGGYEKTDISTGYYYTTVNLSEIESNPKVESVESIEYNVYDYMRTSLFYYYGDWIWDLTGPSYQKIFKCDELLENDANNDGEVSSEDALKVLNVVVGNENLSFEERIQLDIRNTHHFIGDRDYYSMSYGYSEPFGAEKALEILEQTVGLR